MFRFILKGILRDRSRSLFPVLVVVGGVLIGVFTLAFMHGFRDSMIRANARFQTGHVKVVSHAYAEMIDQMPNDLALLDIDDEMQAWQAAYPELELTQRIIFAALMDVPDSMNNTVAQGEILGFAVDLLRSGKEQELLRLNEALIKGRLVENAGEILVSDESFTKLGIDLDSEVTLIGSTVFGSMSFQNFKVVGTVRFGFEALDRGGVIADLGDIQHFLDMEGGAGEILGFFRDGKYDHREADRIKADFNGRFSGEDEFDPVMLTLTDQNSLGAMLAMFDYVFGMFGMVFIAIMGIVIWNSGLMNGIRRYGEIGVRLAMGESKRQLYKAMLAEGYMVGLIGSVIGVTLGMLICWYFNVYGIDVSAYSRETTMVTESVVYTAMDYRSASFGFITGVLSSLVGAALAGLAIFRRQTSQLFKELEA